jgi:hypothetical protein
LYEKIDGIWYLTDGTQISTTKHIYKGRSIPTDDLGENGDQYYHMEYSIQFNAYYGTDPYAFLSACHHGWECPGMYNDTPKYKGNCDILTEWVDREERKLRNGLLLKFTSDDYSETCYLSVEVIGPGLLIISFDHHNRLGIQMKRVPDNAIMIGE